MMSEFPKRHALVRVVDAVEAGERIVLARAGKPIVELVRPRRTKGVKIGVLKWRLDEKAIDRIGKRMSERDGRARVWEIAIKTGLGKFSLGTHA